MVKKHKVRIVSITNLVNGVYTIEMEPINGKFRYAPGQFLHIALDEYDPSMAWPESRCFSMQSSPKEKTLKITYAVKGEFTREMADKFKVGTEVWIKLAYGDLFTQNHNKKKTVFISGGTGITPFLSLFTDSSFSEYENPKVYMGFRDQSLQVYNKEIELTQKNNPSAYLKCIYQDTDGIIDIAQILSDNDVSSSFFISGPPAMIKDFKNYLLTNGVKEENINTDDWE